MNIDSVKGSDLLDIFTLGAKQNMFTQRTTGLIVLWSILVEFIFYLIVPIVVINTKKMGLKYIYSLIFLLLSLQLITNIKDNHSTYYSVITWIPVFLTGMLLPIYLKKIQSTSLMKRISIILLMIVFVVVMFHFNTFIREESVVKVLYYYLYSILFSCIFLLYLILPISFGKPINKFLNYPAKISFSIYLIHRLISESVYSWHFERFINSHLADLINASMSVSLSYLLASIAYYTIEKPFLEKKVSYLNKD